MRSMRLWVWRWFDTWAAESNPPSASPDRVNWIRVVPFIALHIACLAIIFIGFSWVALYFCVFMYVGRMLAITAFYHRYFSHRAFKTSRSCQFIFAVLGNSAAQRGPLWWAAHHRFHHRYSDTSKDVHSPRQQGFWYSHVGWIFSDGNFHTRKALVKDLMRFPELIFLDRFDWLVPALTAATLYGVGHWFAISAPGWETNGLQILLWGFVLSTTLVFHATCAINSVAHVWGSRKYEGDDSRNNLLLSLITLGEGWHNNHHRFPQRARQGTTRWEPDPTYLFLTALRRVGLIREIRR